MASSGTVTTTQADSNIPLGLSVPPDTPHAISVSLPTWSDNVGYEEGDKRVINAMVSGYPRFFIHLSIQKLSSLLEQKYGLKGEKCMLFPRHQVAEQCRSFMQALSVSTRIIDFICPETKDTDRYNKDPASPAAAPEATIHIVLFPSEAFQIAKQFWQHTGMGISSRFADHCLSLLTEDNVPRSPSPSIPRFPKGNNKHYSVKTSNQAVRKNSPILPETLEKEHNVYLEERYGRVLPLAYAASAKRALRRRIAGVLLRDDKFECQGEPCAGKEDLQVGPSSRGVADVSEDDVFLFPTGMSAIWNAHQLALAVRPAAKSVCFGFPYTDTLKILQKWGPGCHFFGAGVDSEMDQLEAVLAQESIRDPTNLPILALFTEFPSNPLLRSADLARLRGLADRYDFLIVVDETLGNFVNVEVISYADIVVSSLSKIFSGVANVMGGSLVLNPHGRHYVALKAHMSLHYQDIYYDEDAIYMERNSRDFKRRIRLIDINSEALCDFLRSHSAAAGATDAIIKEVFYPKYVSPENYERCRIKADDSDPSLLKGGGYGGLFSLTFTSSTASQAFFDALSCFKGPSLGTNFTLACPYTILAHFAELEWAAQYGIEEGLVRVSVGMENTEDLLRLFDVALSASREAVLRAHQERVSRES